MNGVFFSAFYSKSVVSCHVILTHPILRLFILIFLQNASITLAFASSDYFLESKISDALTSNENSHNIVWLKTTEKRSIFALHETSNINKIQGGIIIFADLDQTPDWPVIVQGLRRKLPNFGWETLSVQMPIPKINTLETEMDNIYEITRLRLNAAIQYYKAKNVENIILIGIHQSANLSLKYLQEVTMEKNELQAVVIIRAFDSSWYKSSDSLRTISIPVLDIFAQYDTQRVLISGGNRLISNNFSGKLKNKSQSLKISSKVKQLALNKTGSLRYRQSIINGANYKFEKQEDLLLKTVRGWLFVHAAGREVMKK